MTKIFYIFKFTVLIAAILPLSCATALHPTKSISKLDDNNSIIFGKIELLENDKPMDKPFETFLDPEPFILNHISRYFSDTSLNRNLWKAGEYFFKVPVFKDGYFSVVVPPGKYYFVEIIYCDFFNAKPMFGVRTYMGKNPFLMTFDAPADKAVYIGTIRNDFHTKWNNWFFVKGTLSIDSTNNFEEAKNWFLKSNQRFTTNVVEGVLKIKNLSN